MSVVSAKWEELKKLYVEYLVRNVDLVTSIESWTKTLSYLVAGRISKSHSTVIAELLYASSNLATLLNDHILRKHYKTYQVEESGARLIKMMLAGLEAVEVFVEIAARRYGSPTLKWILIFCVELIKMIGRFTLLHRHGDGIRHFPIMKRLNRKSLNAESDSEGEDNQPAPEADQYYTLPNSGRKIKSVSSKYRQGATSASAGGGGAARKTVLTDHQKFAESLHSLQPILHLLPMAVFGEKSWIPWIASFATDVSSLAMLRDINRRYKYSKSEEGELVRRKFVLLMYLLRSPCYDRYTKTKLLRLLGLLSRVPGLGYIMNAVVAYLPEWQSTYFYTWNA